MKSLKALIFPCAFALTLFIGVNETAAHNERTVECEGPICQENLMDMSIYDALISAGVQEDRAREIAIESVKNHLHFLTVENELKELRSYVEQFNANLQAYIKQDEEKAAKRKLAAQIILIVFSLMMALIAGTSWFFH